MCSGTVAMKQYWTEGIPHLAACVKKFDFRDCFPYADLSPFDSNPGAFSLMVRLA